MPVCIPSAAVFVYYLWMGADSNRRYMEPAHHFTPELPTLVVSLKREFSGRYLGLLPTTQLKYNENNYFIRFPAFLFCLPLI